MTTTKMATIVQDFGQSKEKTLFSDSSEEDKAYAKTFWQSVQLLPPMESRLVSSNIRQRLKVAPPGHQPVNVNYPDHGEPQVLTTFLETAKAQQYAEETGHLQELATLRNEEIQRLHRHRQFRLQKEQLSQRPWVRAAPGGAASSRQQDADTAVITAAEDEAALSLQEIEEFERRQGRPAVGSDSD